MIKMYVIMQDENLAFDWGSEIFYDKNTAHARCEELYNTTGDTFYIKSVFIKY